MPLIHTSNQVMTILHTYHNVLRQHVNNVDGLSDTISGKQMTVTHRGIVHSIPSEEALKIVQGAGTN